MKLSVLVLGPGSAVHVIHPSVYFRDHQRTRPDGSPSSADSGRIDERETYRLVSKSSSRREACWASATKLPLRSIHKSLYALLLRFSRDDQLQRKVVGDGRQDPPLQSCAPTSRALRLIAPHACSTHRRATRAVSLQPSALQVPTAVCGRRARLRRLHLWLRPVHLTYCGLP